MEDVTGFAHACDDLLTISPQRGDSDDERREEEKANAQRANKAMWIGGGDDNEEEEEGERGTVRAVECLSELADTCERLRDKVYVGSHLLMFMAVTCAGLSERTYGCA